MSTTLPRCLIVAPDAADIATLASEISARHVCDVVVASSRPAAQAAIRSAAFDVLFVDAALADADTLEPQEQTNDADGQSGSPWART